MGDSLSIGEVIEEVCLRRVDAGQDRGLARVADRAWRQAGVLARVVRRVDLELGKCRLGRQASQRVQQGGVDTEGDALPQAVVVDAAYVPAVGARVGLAVHHRSKDDDRLDRLGGPVRGGLRDLASKLSLIHISEPTRLGMISYAVFCL